MAKSVTVIKNYMESGTIIGVTGNTGRSTGSHLHLTCKKDGESFNPTILLNLIEKSFALSAYQLVNERVGYLTLTPLPFRTSPLISSVLHKYKS